MSLSTVSFLAALALIVAGVALASIPAAFVVSGVLLAALTWMLDEDSA